MERVLVVKQLTRQKSTSTLSLFGYVVMPDHVHLLITPPHHGLSAMMREFKARTGRQLRDHRGGSGAIWQQRYFDFVLRRVEDFWGKLEYIHRNPVEAGLTRRPEEWLWSSVAHYSGGSSLSPVDHIDLPPDRKAWLYPAPWRR